MKTIIYNNQNENKWTILAKGLIATIIGILGLILDTKIILKLVIYILPLLLITYSIPEYKKAIYFLNKNKKEFISRTVKSTIPILIAIYIIIHPINSLNLVIIIIGVIQLINALWLLFIENTLKLSSILLGIICICLSELIINTFYSLFLIVLLAYGIYQIYTFKKLNELS